VRFVRITPPDVQQVAAFPRDRSDYVKFPLNNPTRFGLDGIDNLAPRMWRNGDGALSDVLSVTKTGMVMPYLPSGDFDAAADAVPDRISREMAENHREILMDGDTHVAATAFNAALPQTVQIGAVYTPPALRGKGHARRAHLAQARTTGVRRATLFASAQNAIAGYAAVGFKHIGDWVLAIFKTPQVVP
jgi:predicted GNAT family acetyltransferase